MPRAEHAKSPAKQLVLARESGGYGRGSAREPRDDGSERRGPSEKLIAALGDFVGSEAQGEGGKGLYLTDLVRCAIM